MRKIKSISLLILSLMILSSCNEQPTSNDDGLPFDELGREDFQAFHEKFFNERKFQLSRIDFPVMGPMQEDGRPKFIEEEDWPILKPTQKDDPTIKRQIVFTAEDLVEEYVVVQQAFVIKIRYTLNKATNQWNLTYYSGVSDPKLRPTADERFSDTSRTIAVIDSNAVVGDSLKSE
jgi:hypothetical protein